MYDVGNRIQQAVGYGIGNVAAIFKCPLHYKIRSDDKRDGHDIGHDYRLRYESNLLYTLIDKLDIISKMPLHSNKIFETNLNQS